MLSKLAYLALCRSIQLLVLLAAATPPRTWRSWCCATNWPCCAAKSHGPGSSPPTAPCSPHRHPARRRHRRCCRRDQRRLDRLARNAERYDPATGSWRRAGTTTTGRADATATLLGDGSVVLAGGDNPSGLASAELYDPSTLSTRGWSANASMTIVHALATAVLLQDGRVLEEDGGATAQTGDVYASTTGTWTATDRLVDPNLQRSAAALLPDGQVLYAGGNTYACGVQDCFQQPTANAELYTP